MLSNNKRLIVNNSYADAVTYDPVTKKEYFVMPYEQHMPFNSFLDLVEGKTASENANYISLQNGSLPVEYRAIEKDVDMDIAWCSDALGKKPDAVNFWFGDDKSATSLHKDPYENCYAVVRGQKTFILFPPTEYYCMHGKQSKQKAKSSSGLLSLCNLLYRIHVSKCHLRA